MVQDFVRSPSHRYLRQKSDAYLHFTAVLNDSGKGAQSRRNGCSI